MAAKTNNEIFNVQLLVIPEIIPIRLKIKTKEKMRGKR
jgi:hypothetical protein|tara:strand:+ start:627 stop:740 length:114 start_codon:yes stop_codon:yes gene_type:complete